MIFVMLATLYTSRIILNALGIVDYGIYNVVGGVVTMLGFVNSSLAGATSRFLTYELGNGNISELQKVFRCTLTIHYILAIIVLLIGETIGMWFLNEKMVIPIERMNAAMWVYQSSIITILISIISAPYNALIIAFERMSAFAYISIIEVLGKLLIAFILIQINSDKLIAYAVLTMLFQIIIRIIYTFYCSRLGNFSWHWLWNRDFSLKVLNYAGWTINGDLAIVGLTQGINILLNLYFGPVVNAARSIAVQIQAAANQFFINFQMAVRPRVIKAYAQCDFAYMHYLIVQSSKYSFFLAILIVVPLFVNIDYILFLWLGNVPEYTSVFVRMMLLSCVILCFSMPMLTAIHATGDLKKFQLIEGTLLLSVIPIAFLLLKYCNVSPVIVLLVGLIIELLTQIVRVWIVCPRIGMSYKYYCIKVIPSVVFVSIPVCVITIVMCHFVSASVGQLIINVLICLSVIIIAIWILGISTVEKKYILSMAKRYLNGRKKQYYE